MMSLNRIHALGVQTALIVVFSALSLAAQEPSAKDSGASSPPSSTKRAYDPSRRVPPYFGQLGLSSDQKETIYKMRSKHYTKILALQKELAEAQAAMLSECETVLSDPQKQSLQERRQLAADAKKGRRLAKASPDPAKPATATP